MPDEEPLTQTVPFDQARAAVRTHNPRTGPWDREDDIPRPAPDPISLQVDKLWYADDVTVFMKMNEFQSQMGAVNQSRHFGTLGDYCAIEAEIDITSKIANDNPAMYKRTGRALICPCHNREWISITFRKESELFTVSKDNNGNRKEHEVTKSPENLIPTCSKVKLDEFKEKGEFQAKQLNAKDKLKFLFSVQDCARLIYAQLPKPNPQGLIVLSGSTGTGKSKVVRGLIHHYLCDKLDVWKTKHKRSDSNAPVPLERRLHLITYEDPIEKILFENPTCEDAELIGIDYTPRCGKRDVRCLADALSHAKRQTPAIFYIGEVRDNKDWKQILTFAGEGNLVITTTHANSVLECMTKIFDATDARTPDRRGEVASKLLGVIHLSSAVVEDSVPASAAGSVSLHPSTFTRTATLPSLWRQTPQGINQLGAVGLSSLVPQYDATINDEFPSGQSCIGQRWFAKRLMLKAKDDHDELKSDIGLYARIEANLDKITLKYDTEKNSR